MTRLEDIPALCAALIRACAEGRAYQSRFLDAEKLTWDQARGLNEAGRAALQKRFDAWRAVNPA